jgi:hypothetical protein
MNCIHFNWGKVLTSEQVMSELTLAGAGRGGTSLDLPSAV